MIGRGPPSRDTRQGMALEGLPEELLDVLPAELGALHHGVADALGGLLHARPDRAAANLLGALLHLLGRLVHLGLVGGAGHPAAQDRDCEEGGSDPQRAHLPCPCHGGSSSIRSMLAGSVRASAMPDERRLYILGLVARRRAALTWLPRAP